MNKFPFSELTTALYPISESSAIFAEMGLSCGGGYFSVYLLCGREMIFGECLAMRSEFFIVLIFRIMQNGCRTCSSNNRRIE
jgi:hypothetical protein